MSVRALLGQGLVARRVCVEARDVVFVKGLFEASEGLGMLFAEHGGELVLAAPESRVVEFEQLLRDLEAEVGARVMGEISTEQEPLADHHAVRALAHAADARRVDKMGANHGGQASRDVESTGSATSDEKLSGRRRDSRAGSAGRAAT